MRLALAQRTLDELTRRGHSHAHLGALGGEVDPKRLMQAIRGKADDETHAIVKDMARKGRLRMDALTARFLVALGVDPVVAALIRDAIGSLYLTHLDADPGIRDQTQSAVALNDDQSVVMVGESGATWNGASRTLIMPPLPETLVAALPGRPLSTIIAFDLPGMVDVSVASARVQNGRTLVRLRISDDGRMADTLVGVAAMIDARYDNTSA